MTFSQLNDWTEKLRRVWNRGRRKVAMPTVLTTRAPVLKEFKKTENPQA